MQKNLSWRLIKLGGIKHGISEYFEELREMRLNVLYKVALSVIKWAFFIWYIQYINKIW